VRSREIIWPRRKRYQYILYTHSVFRGDSYLPTDPREAFRAGGALDRSLTKTYCRLASVIGRRGRKSRRSRSLRARLSSERAGGLRSSGLVKHHEARLSVRSHGEGRGKYKGIAGRGRALSQPSDAWRKARSSTLVLRESRCSQRAALRWPPAAIRDAAPTGDYGRATGGTSRAAEVVVIGSPFGAAPGGRTSTSFRRRVIRDSHVRFQGRGRAAPLAVASARICGLRTVGSGGERRRLIRL